MDKWHGGPMLTLDIPRRWDVTQDEVLTVVHAIQLDDGTYLADPVNRTWRIDNPVSTMRMVVEAMIEAYGKPKRDWLEAILDPNTKESDYDEIE